MTNLKKRVASHKILQFLQNNKVIFFFQKKSIQNDHWRLLKKKIANIEGVATLNMKNKRDRKEIHPLILYRVFSLEKTSLISNANKRSALDLQEKFGVFCKRKNDKSANLWQSQSTLLSAQEEMATLFNDSSLTKSKRLSSSFKEEKTQTSNQETGIHEKNPQQNLDLESENKFKIVEQICDLLYAPNLILGSNSLEKLVGLSHQLKEDSNLVFIGGWDGKQLINHLDSLKLLETSKDIWKEGLSCLSSSYAKPYLFLHSLLEKRKRSLIYSLKEKMQALTRSLQQIKAPQKKE